MRKQTKKFRQGKYTVGSALVHLVWLPKRKKAVLIGEVKIRLGQIIAEIATEKKWVIKSLKIEPYYVYVHVEHDPKSSVNSIVKSFKGKSSNILRNEFPYLRKLPTLWTHLYFYDTSEAKNFTKIKAYIDDESHS